jgi:hypothetical protein
MPFDQTRAGILDRLSPDGQKASLGREILALNLQQQELLARIETLEAALATHVNAASAEPRFFARTAAINPQNAATRTALLTEDELAAGQKAYPMGFFLALAGETPWSGGTGRRLYLADSGTDLIYRFAEIDPCVVLAGSYLGPDSDGVTLTAEYTRGLGGRAGKGIDILADGPFAEGSDITVTVYGYLA